MKIQSLYLSIVVLSLFLSGCMTSRDRLLSTEESQLQLRSMQSRTYETQDTDKVIRAALASLQDLDFVIDKADKSIGMITATKLFSGTRLTVTVTIRSRGRRTLVRMNAEYQNRAVTEPIHYQNFFSVLSKSLFLDAVPVE